MTIIIAIAVPALMFVSAVVFIGLEYIIKPHKSIREGLSDWYHESDNDI